MNYGDANVVLSSTWLRRIEARALLAGVQMKYHTQHIEIKINHGKKN
jgi:hypothetical protein